GGAEVPGPPPPAPIKSANLDQGSSTVAAGGVDGTGVEVEGVDPPPVPSWSPPAWSAGAAPVSGLVGLSASRCRGFGSSPGSCPGTTAMAYPSQARPDWNRNPVNGRMAP